MSVPGETLNQEQRASPLQQFLNPQSMVTPGVAGMLDLTIAKSLEPIFHMNILHLMLAFGFIIGAIVFLYEAKLLQKIIFYVLNSLIVYCVAFGLYATSSNTTIQPDTVPAPITVQKGSP